MATREGSIRVTLERGSFKASMRKMAGDMSAQGRAMGRALSGSMSAGLSNVGKAMKNTLADLKNGFKTVMTLGGALGGGALVKDAMDAQTQYLQLADALTTYTGKAHNAAQVQELIGKAAAETKVPIGGLRQQMMQLASASGKVDIGSLLERAASQARRLGVEGEIISRVYSRLVAKGVATTADEAENLTEQMNKLYRNMLGVDLDEAIDPNDVAELAGFVNTTGNSFAQMLRVISMGGDEVAKDFGKINEIPEELGEKLKQSKGIDEMTKKLKLTKGVLDINKSALENMLSIADMGPEKFAAMADAFGDVPRSALLHMLGGDEFVAAAAAGKISGKEWTLKVEKFRKEVSDLSSVAADRAAMEAADARHKNSAAAQLDDAINKIRDAFTQPKMIGAIEKLAKQLPTLANAMADLIGWISENPLMAVSAGVGMKVGGSFASGAITHALSGAGSIGQSGAASQAAKTARGLEKVEKKALGAADALKGFGAGLVALDVGVLIGQAFNKYILDPQNEKYNNAVDAALDKKTSTPTTIEGKQKALKKINKKSMDLLANFASPQNAFAGGMSMIGVGESPLVLYQESQMALMKETVRILKAYNKQRDDIIDEKFRSQMKSFKDDVYNAGKALQKAFPNTPTRGPLKSPDDKPGADPVKG